MQHSLSVRKGRIIIAEGRNHNGAGITGASWRPDPHKLDAFIGQVAKAKAIHERLGAAVNVAQTQVGGEAMTMVYMLTFESGANYGAFIDALSDDSEWQSFWAEAVASAVSRTGLVRPLHGGRGHLAQSR